MNRKTAQPLTDTELDQTAGGSLRCVSGLKLGDRDNIDSLIVYDDLSKVAKSPGNAKKG